MSRLDQALARFEAALDRLEMLAGERGADETESTHSAAELSLLRAEREKLMARIALLEEESRNLAGLTAEAEDRIDGAMAEIREALGRN